MLHDCARLSYCHDISAQDGLGARGDGAPKHQIDAFHVSDGRWQMATGRCASWESVRVREYS